MNTKAGDKVLKLTDKNKALCFDDSVEKPFFVYFYYFDEDYLSEYGGTWRYFTTISNADIVQESVELTEGILEGETFLLGSVVAPTLKLSWAYTGISYKNLVCIPVQKIGTQYIAYFDGYVSNEQISDDGTTVEVEITSFLADKLDKTIRKDYISMYNNGTVAECINGAIGQSLGIFVNNTQLEREFLNARIKLSFPDDSIPETVTLSDFLKQAGEFIGGHWCVEEKRIVTPQELKKYTPSTSVELGFVRIANINKACIYNYRLLPEQYEVLPYIETTGDQYIITDIYPDDTTKIDIKFKADEFTGGSIIGNSSGQENDQFRFFNYNGGAYLDYGSGAGYNRIYSANEIFYRIYHLEIGNRYVKDLDTSRYILNADRVSFDEKTYPLQIFGHRADDLSKVTLYSCIIYKNNSVVGNLIPCHNTVSDLYGLYNTANDKFYSLLGNSNTAIIPKPIYNVEIPYYISLKNDATSRLTFSEINLSTKTINGYEQYYYDYTFGNFNNPNSTVYSIEENLFYEGAIYNDRFKALEEVATYLQNLNFTKNSLQCPYVPFVEPKDYISIIPKNQSLLSGDEYETLTDINGEVITDIYGSAIEPIIAYSKYVLLESIALKNNTPYEQRNYCDTQFRPKSDDVTIDITFELLGGYSVIFDSETIIDKYTSLRLATIDGRTLALSVRHGDYQNNTVYFDYVPSNQVINLKFHFYKGTLTYSGTFNGQSTYNTPDGSGKLNMIADENINLGSTHDTTNVKIYRFSATQVKPYGVEKVDIVPAYDKSIGKPVFYDIEAEYQTNAQYNSGQYSNAIRIVPLLSTQAQGIHSQIATFESLAVNI